RSAGQRARDDVALWRRRKASAAGSAGPENPRRDSRRRDRDRACQGQDRRNAVAIMLPADARPSAANLIRLVRDRQEPFMSSDHPSDVVDPKLLEILVCPLTKTPLEYDAQKQELISRAAKLAYPIRDGIPIMLPEEARHLD